MIDVVLLADHPESIPILGRWFQAQWPDYYGERSLTDIAQDFRKEASRSSIPVRLVAFADGLLAGTVCLRKKATWTLPQYRPGLGGLFVPERFRGQGVGTELVRAGMKLARERDYEKVYATTVNARGILEHLGWELVEAISHDDDPRWLYRCKL